MCKEHKSISLLLVDDHAIIREGISHALGELTDIEIVGQACSGLEALDLVRELRPDVVLMDISMPGINGIEATRHIVKDGSGARIIILSMHADRHYIVEAIKAGAKGYLQKNCSISTLYDAITTIAQNGVYFSPPQYATYLLDLLGDLSHPPALSPREHEVLRLLVEGQNTKEIAYGIGISIKTVEFHRQQIKKKLNINNIAELTKYAVREGITSL